MLVRDAKIALSFGFQAPPFSADYLQETGAAFDGAQIMARARSGDAAAKQVFDRYVDRLGRALAMVCDIVDPDVIVLGGGMSNIPELYDQTLPILSERIFSDMLETRVLQARHGDSSGVRGAAWLWPREA